MVKNLIAVAFAVAALSSAASARDVDFGGGSLPDLISASQAQAGEMSGP
jgi:opacity protein-like surface antigen